MADLNSHRLSAIVSDVRIVLDQNAAETGILSSNRDTLELDALIKQKVLHAARQILEVAPLRMISRNCSMQSQANQTLDNYLVDVSEITDSTTVNGSPVTLYLSQDEPQSRPRPGDFLRLFHADVVEGSEDAEVASKRATREIWQVPVTSYEMTDSEAFMKANSLFSGVKPNPRRPALFLDPVTDSFLFYGCSYGHARLYYIKIPKLITKDSNGNTIDSPYIHFPDVLYEALLYQTASLVETAYKNLPAAQMYSSIARSYMGLGENDTKTQTTKQK